MSNEPDASRRLSRNKDRVLAAWEQLARESVPAARHEARLALRDSMPDVLDDLVAALADPDPRQALIRAEARIAVDHGRQRASIPEYSLEQVIREYEILRRVLFDVLEASGQELQRAERDLILDVVMVSIRNAAAEFKLVRDAEREGTARSLERVNLALNQALEAKSAEVKLNDQLVASLERERDLRERFVFTLSHDLKNPLAAAKASAQLIARHSCGEHKHADLALRAIRSIGRAEKMIGDLLDASHIQAGEPFPLTIEACDLSQVVRQAHDDLATISGDRFAVSAPDSLPGYWDPQGLRRVIENLVTNAIKYGDPTGVVTTRLEALGDRVLVHVHNFGAVISPQDQGSLFELFHRSEAARRGSTRGWGLGLTLVRGITEAHGGVVKVTSLPDDGTTFTLDLPRDARTRPASSG